MGLVFNDELSQFDQNVLPLSDEPGVNDRMIVFFYNLIGQFP